MDFWYVMWGSILLIVLVSSFVEYKKSLLQMKAKLNDFEESVVVKELESVKARLAVLEIIITDKSYDLREEMERLNI